MQPLTDRLTWISHSPHCGWSRMVDAHSGANHRCRAVGEACMQMTSDPRLSYHNWDHNCWLWEWASVLGMDYDPNLDAAIMMHDSVYDEFAEKERRSADLFWSYYNNGWFGEFTDRLNPEKVDSLIMTTAGHKWSDDNRMIMLDLADLTVPYRTARNLFLIANESMKLYNITIAQAMDGTREFMETFSETVAANHRECLNPSGDLEGAKFWGKVVAGVELNIQMAEGRAG